MKFKVGDKVYCKHHKKYGFVIRIKRYGIYEIRVDIINKKGEVLIKDVGYTKDGRWHTNDNFKSLFRPLKIKVNKLLEL